ncbi:MAG TPA: hypothetical protein VG013_30370 [Gemmataceae bacterium]|nr:hypothetical protein [Gemmataceae bacterium]
MAARLVEWLAGWTSFPGKVLRVVTDRGYAQGPFHKPARAR